jgi:pimeloyl-ACP methyl ester carboxylesterase
VPRPQVDVASSPNSARFLAVDITPDAQVLHQPTFWAKTPLDVVGVVAGQEPIFERFCTNGTAREYPDAGHWVFLSHGEELAKDLQAWVEGL